MNWEEQFVVAYKKFKIYNEVPIIDKNIIVDVLKNTVNNFKKYIKKHQVNLRISSDYENYIDLEDHIKVYTKIHVKIEDTQVKFTCDDKTIIIKQDNKNYKIEYSDHESNEVEILTEEVIEEIIKELFC